ncbi:MAG TPA: insulinase family protein, partial [Clostridiaceae bacterium]|nr:insulinase family protein [Clostridiaceae bacterium]
MTVVPKPRFSRKFAAIVVPYGSVHTRFREADDPQKIVEVPPGTAYFLEQCLFSGKTTESGDLIRRFAALGVRADAYT